MKSGGSPIPLVLAALSVLVLVGVVAVASTGSTPSGSGETRRPADIVIDTIFSFGLLLLIPAAAILVYGLMQRKEIARLVASGSYRRTGLVGFLLCMLVFGLLTALGFWGLLNARLRRGDDEFADGIFPGNDVPFRPEDPGKVATAYEPEFAWIPVLVVFGLAAIGIAAFVLAHRSRQRPLAPDDAVVAEEVANFLEDSLDDLSAEPDARRAIIAAYARLESALAGSGLPRRAQETADEYIRRILQRLEVDSRPVRELTDLYTRAKFSHHDVSQAMKNAAIGALAQIRDELRAAARRREEESDRALSAREQAAAS